MDVSRENERVRALANRQAGRVTRAQLRRLGVSDDAIYSRTRSGSLKRVLPKVYAVGHDAPSSDADLWAAVLYAGPGAMLSHTSAAHHLGLINHAPKVIHVSTPRSKVPSIAGCIVVHRERKLDRIEGPVGVPTTTIIQTLLDLARATTAPGAGPTDAKLLRRALGVLDYRGQLDLEALRATCRSGRPGIPALRAALEQHHPEFARANEGIEERFLDLCIEWQVPIPEVNVWLYGELVDAYWPAHALVVELDGGHHLRPWQQRRDRARDLKLRSHGITVVRYDWDLVTRRPLETHADLLDLLSVGWRATGANEAHRSIVFKP